MTTWEAILLVVACAVCWDVGIVLQKRASARLPAVVLGRGTPAAVGALLRSPGWLGGLGISALGWGLFALALTVIPVSVARAVQGSGFALLALFSVLFLSHRLSAPEWLGVALVTGGVVLLGVTVPPAISETPLLWRTVAGSAGCIGLSLLPLAVKLVTRAPLPWTVVVSIPAGTLLGLGDVMTKGVLLEVGAHHPGAAFALFAPLLIAVYSTGFFTLSRGYQHGRALVVTAVSDFCSRVVTIVMGLFAFGEGAATDHPLTWVGFGAVLAGTALLAGVTGDEVGSELSRGKEPGDATPRAPV